MIKTPTVKLDPVWWHNKFHILIYRVSISKKALKLGEAFQGEDLNNKSRRRLTYIFHYSRGISPQFLHRVARNEHAHVIIVSKSAGCFTLCQKIDLRRYPPHIDCLGRIRVGANVMGNSMLNDVIGPIEIKYVL